MKRWLPLIPLAILLVLGVLFAGYALRRSSPQVMPDALVGQAAPDLNLPVLDGPASQNLTEALGGGPAMINVFASWCAPCALEHPELMRLKAQGVRIVGIAYKDEPANTRGFINRLGDPYATILVDRPGDAGVELGVSGVPETFLVGADGMIFAKHSGPMDAAKANALAERLKRGR